MEKFHCPNAIKREEHKFLMCKLAMKDGVDYHLTENALKTYCACQRYCQCEKGVINSDGAKKCYEEWNKLLQHLPKK